MSKFNANNQINSFFKKNEQTTDPVTINEKKDVSIHANSNLAVFNPSSDNAIISLTRDNKSRMRVVDNYRARGLESKKRLEAQAVVYDTQIKLVEDQAKAITAESKVYWGTRVSQYCEILKVNGQDLMTKLDIEKTTNLNANLRKLYAETQASIKAVEDDSTLNDMLKQRQIETILENMITTEESIKNQTTAGKYDLT